MNKKYQNGFFIFGIAVLALMLTQLDYAEVRHGLQRAGYWSAAVVALWAALYVLNTTTWHIIIRQSRTATDRRMPGFWWLYKITVSGFALNYATPCGLMGGEPYRIMALTPKVGTQRASSSVILFAMTHIFSHFWFWLLSIVIYLITSPLTPAVSVILLLATLFCCLGLWFFMKGYKKGMAVRLARWTSHIPWIGPKAQRLINDHRTDLEDIDRQIAALHGQSPRTFVMAVLSELACRFLSCLEVMFILLVVMPSVAYTDCVIIIAFTSLFANLLFFIPLQLGGREGGFLMATTGLAMSVSNGVFVALIVRLRELLWTAIGLALIKMERTKR